MKAPLLAATLENARIAGHPVEIHRDGLSGETLVGRIIAASEWVVLIEKVVALAPDGVAAVRPAHITRVRQGTRELASYVNGVAWNNPTFPQEALLELSAAATFLQRQYGHVTFHAEHSEHALCFVGRMIDVDDNHVLLDEFGPMSRSEQSRLLLRYEFITRVDGGGGYEQRLLKHHAKEP